MLFYAPRGGEDKSYLDDNDAIKKRTIDAVKYNGLQCVCRAQVRSLILSLGSEIGFPVDDEYFFEAVSGYYFQLQGDDAHAGGSEWLLKFIASEFGGGGVKK